jgi:phenylalanyl-tRNA synthetase beta chain
LAEGLQEFVTCSLISPKMVEIVRNHPISGSNLVKVLNPMSEEQSILRPSLLPGLLDVVKLNNNQRLFDIAGFEIGNIHFKKGDKFVEQLVVGIVLAGRAVPYHFATPERKADFFDLKGMVESLLRGLQIAGSSLCFAPAAIPIPIFHSGRQAAIISSGFQIGTIAELHPALLRKLDIHERLFFAELNVQDLMQLPKVALHFEALPDFPSSERDWTVTVSEQVTYDEIVGAVQLLKSPILESISLVSIFRHEKLGPGNKNISLHFVYRDTTKTISQSEVDSEHKRLIEACSKAFAIPSKE